MNKDAGILIIEVKDWKLDHYELNPKNNWILKKDGTQISSPLWQVQNYKENLFELHSEALFEKKIRVEAPTTSIQKFRHVSR